jgi:hypothetical protein
LFILLVVCGLALYPGLLVADIVDRLGLFSVADISILGWFLFCCWYTGTSGTSDMEVLEMADFAGMTPWLMPLYADTYLIYTGTPPGYWICAALFITGKVAPLFLFGWLVSSVGWLNRY